MNLLRKTWGIVIAVIISSCHSATFDTISPDGTLKVGVVTTKDGDYGKAAFVVHYKGDSILFRSELGLETDAQKFAGNLRLKSVSEPKSVIDDYRMITGKRSHCVNEASERVYSLENDEGQTLEVTFRVYNDSEMDLIRMLAAFPQEIVMAAEKYDPSRINRFVIDLASAFHRFYGSCRIQGADPAVQQARLALCIGVKNVIFNVLTMFKINVPEKM